MCTLYNRIIDLCKTRGVSGSRMCLDLGLSKSTLSNMKSGRTSGLSTATAQKIASYFGVTVGYLLGEEEKKETAAEIGNGLSESKKQLIELAEQCSDEEAEKFLQMMQILLNKK